MESPDSRGSFFLHKLEKMDSKKIITAIQGGQGSFHHIAAERYFNHHEIEVVPCTSFRSLFAKLRNQACDYAVCAVENSVAGSILQNFSHIVNYGAKIVGEEYLRIEQNLIVHHSTQEDEIIEIYSHPVAIEQCRVYLDRLVKRGVRVVESEDTALSVKYIKDNNLTHSAAIAGSFAAELYGMKILKRGIEDNKRNFTRFLILQHCTSSGTRSIKPAVINKASVCFTLPHKTGSLSSVLSIFSYYGINLTKIESRPIIGKEWEYLFYTDLLFDDLSTYNHCLAAIKPLVSELIILGEYENGRKED